MPIRQLLPPVQSPLGDTLRADLEREWRSPDEKNPEPVIVMNQSAGQATHLYVIWDAWSPLDQRERSEIMMDVYEKLAGLETAAKVTIAMGLTWEEADRMGLKFK